MAASPDAQLDSFMAEFEPEVASRAASALATLRKRLRGAIELVYDNYNALVIVFGTSERASDAICSIALYPRWVTLFFLWGAALPDPDRRLEGTGKQIRGIRLVGAKTLDEPAVRALLAAAVAHAEIGLDPKQPRRLVIKSISPKQRSRRPK